MFSPAQAFDIAQRFAGIEEIEGKVNNPQIMAMLKLDAQWPEDDEVPWCSAFMNYVCWLCRLPRSKSLRARSWLQVGRSVPLTEAFVGDVIVLNRLGGPMDPEIINAPGHAGFYAGLGDDHSVIEVLGGNQSNTVKVSRYATSRLLGVRRLA